MFEGVSHESLPSETVLQRRVGCTAPGNVQIGSTLSHSSSRSVGSHVPRLRVCCCVITGVWSCPRGVYSLVGEAAQPSKQIDMSLQTVTIVVKDSNRVSCLITKRDSHLGWGVREPSERRHRLGRELREQGQPCNSGAGSSGTPGGTKCPERSSCLPCEDPVMLPFTQERQPLFLDVRSQNLHLRWWTDWFLKSQKHWRENDGGKSRSQWPQEGWIKVPECC